MRPLLLPLSVLASVALAACARSPDPPAAVVTTDAPAILAVAPSTAPTPLPAPVAAAPAAPTASPTAAPGPGYPWLTDPRAPAPAGVLAERFAPPDGFSRVPLAPRSFGAWLRALPLLPPGTPVLSFSGGVVLPPDHRSLAAVVAIDVGESDLQQCADSVIRLHAEWLFAQGRRDASYRAASGAPMPFARWARGERMVPEGQGFAWSPSARPDDGHLAYRRWLSAVFTFANTGSLARDSDPVAPDDLRPGDFVVQPGAPGHSVLVLDLARDPRTGRRALLLGQGYMPAQSFHVLRPPSGGAGASGASGPWFIVEPGDIALDTPFWAPFPWKTLHRFAGT